MSTESGTALADAQNAQNAQMPERLRRRLLKNTSTLPSVEDIERKQQEAARRREHVIEERLRRIKEVEERCRQAGEALAAYMHQPHDPMAAAEIASKLSTEKLLQLGMDGQALTIDTPASCIFPHSQGSAGTALGSLWVAGRQEFLEPSWFKENNVACIVSLEVINLPPELRVDEHLRFCVVDEPVARLDAVFAAACHFITSARVRGRGVLVHCAAGRSRSVATTLSFLLACHGDGLDYANALAFVRARRPLANPNRGFAAQLKLFAKKHAHPMGQSLDMYAGYAELIASDMAHIVTEI
eukprot:m.14070 g.14070  ORF g.14070 m.14070 type:complete len:299 (+) comp4722_c0_seq1:380-1276(+)